MSTPQNIQAYRVLGCIFATVFSIPVLRFVNTKYVRPFIRREAARLGKTLHDTQAFQAPHIPAMDILSQYDNALRA
ncbi:unnamed protein product [Ectocarpus fasciculatus]